MCRCAGRRPLGATSWLGSGQQRELYRECKEIRPVDAKPRLLPLLQCKRRICCCCCCAALTKAAEPTEVGGSVGTNDARAIEPRHRHLCT